MSFILDALKKSELERQRQTMPGLMDAGAMPRRARLPGWAIALGLLLGINLVVLVVVLWRSGTPSVPSPAAPVTAAATPAPATSPAPQAAPPTSPVAAGADHFSPLDPPAGGAAAAAPGAASDAPPEYAPEIPVESSTEAMPAAPTHAPKAVRREPQKDEDERSDDDEVLPSFSELNLTGPQGLPDLHIDVHVYATRPSERFVYINMRKYREGATLQEGPVLERIRRDGVVLDYHGLRFLLPRQ